MIMIWALIGIIVACSLFLLFKDTKNKIQYIQILRIYWVTRDTGTLGTPVVCRAFMRQTAPPWWVGSGIQFRFSKYTFQVGILKYRANDLLDQLDGRYLNDSPKDIRQWR